MTDKPPESPHQLRSALDRVLVHDIKNMGFRLQMLLSNVDEHYGDPEFKRAVEELLRTTVERLDGMVERFSAHEDALLIKVALDLNSVIALGVVPEIWGDPYYLRDALWSLIDNAIEATPAAGKVLVRSFTDVSHKPNRAVVEIIDNGSGMSKEFLRDRLFKPFQTTKPQGVGLGLSTAAEIIRIHDGAISVLSETARPGGTFVRLIFPGIAQEPETAETESPENPAPPPETP